MDLEISYTEVNSLINAIIKFIVPIFIAVSNIENA